MAVGDKVISFGIADFGSGNTYSNHATVQLPIAFPAGDNVTIQVTEHGSDDSDAAYLNTFFALPTMFSDGTTFVSWNFTIDRTFFADHVPMALDGPLNLFFDVIATATNGSGQSDGSQSFLIEEQLVPFNPHILQNDDYGITRGAAGSVAAQNRAHQIDISATTEADYVTGLLQSVADTTIPMVAVEGSMYDHVGSAQEIDGLVNSFLPAQVANAVKYGLPPQVYACEVLGLAFAGGDENHATTFATNYGPSNGSMPNTAAGDAAFASAASQKIFGSAALQHTPDAIANFVANWKAFYTAHGVPGILNPTADQIDLYARGAAWGDAVGVALDGSLGQLPVLTTNFLKDAAQDTALYSASLAVQPIPAPFEGATSSASAVSPVQLAGISADPQHMGL